MIYCSAAWSGSSSESRVSSLCLGSDERQLIWGLDTFAINSVLSSQLLVLLKQCLAGSVWPRDEDLALHSFDRSVHYYDTKATTRTSKEVTAWNLTRQKRANNTSKRQSNEYRASYAQQERRNKQVQTPCVCNMPWLWKYSNTWNRCVAISSLQLLISLLALTRVKWPKRSEYR